MALAHWEDLAEAVDRFRQAWEARPPPRRKLGTGGAAFGTRPLGGSGGGGWPLPTRIGGIDSLSPPRKSAGSTRGVRPAPGGGGGGAPDAPTSSSGPAPVERVSGVDWVSRLTATPPLGGGPGGGPPDTTRRSSNRCANLSPCCSLTRLSSFSNVSWLMPWFTAACDTARLSCCWFTRNCSASRIPWKLSASAFRIGSFMISVATRRGGGAK